MKVLLYILRLNPWYTEKKDTCLNWKQIFKHVHLPAEVLCPWKTHQHHSGSIMVKGFIILKKKLTKKVVSFVQTTGSGHKYFLTQENHNFLLSLISLFRDTYLSDWSWWDSVHTVISWVGMYSAHVYLIRNSSQQFLFLEIKSFFLCEAKHTVSY